jgi:hypothetical protein
MVQADPRELSNVKVVSKSVKAVKRTNNTYQLTPTNTEVATHWTDRWLANSPTPIQGTVFSE